MTYRPFHQEGHLYFITASISGWKCLFYDSQYVNIILSSLDFLRKKKRHLLYSFVVMPNHVHFINKPREGFIISDVIQNFASFAAHEILKQLRKENKQELIDFFRGEALTLQARTPGGAGEWSLRTPGGTRRGDYLRRSRSCLDFFSRSRTRHAQLFEAVRRADPRLSFRSRMRPRMRRKTKHKIWQNIQAKNIFSLGVLEQKMEYIHSNPCNKKWHLVKDRADYQYSSACYYDRGKKPIIEIDNLRELF